MIKLSERFHERSEQCAQWVEGVKNKKINLQRTINPTVSILQKIALTLIRKPLCLTLNPPFPANPFTILFAPLFFIA
jgi:hypothetical protein